MKTVKTMSNQNDLWSNYNVSFLGQDLLFISHFVVKVY